MTTPTKLGPAGVGQLVDPCWYIARIDGKEFCDGYEPHFPDRAAVEAGIVQHANEDMPAPFLEPVEEKERCWTLNLVCGTEWIYHGDVEASHFASKADLLEMMDYTKDVVQLDGENRYAECGCCEVCDAAVEGRAANPPVEVLLDQAPLFPTAGDTIPKGWTL